MELNTLFYLAVILLSGLLFGRLVKLIKLPNVTGYLLAGLVIGPYVLKLIPQNIADSMGLVSEMALAFIAFTIGLSFKRSYFKKVGFAPVLIALFEALFAVFFVQIALVLTGNDVASVSYTHLLQSKPLHIGWEAPLFLMQRHRKKQMLPVAAMQAPFLL